MKVKRQERTGKRKGEGGAEKERLLAFNECASSGFETSQRNSRIQKC